MRIGLLIGIISGLLWGLNDVFTNLFSLQIDLSSIYVVIIFSLGLAFLQDAFSSIGIFSYYLSRKEFTKNIHLTKKGFWLLVFAAISAGPLGMVAGIMGISYAGPVYAGVVTSCYPVVALILATFLLRERATALKYFGIIITVVAVILISIQGEKSEIENISLGIIFAAIAMMGWGFESILFSLASKKTLLRPSWLLGVRQFISALSYLLILIILLIVNHHIVFAIFQQMTSVFLIIACVLSASFSYLAYYFTIRKMGASLGTTFNATFIFWAAIFSVLFGLSHLSFSFWIWACILIIGIYCACYTKK